MAALQIVIDTNVIVAGLRSPRGASYLILGLLGSSEFDFHLSGPLVLEYEAVALRHLSELPITQSDVDDFLNYLCSIGIAHEIYYMWRAFLPDPGDDMLLEVAVASGSDVIVTFNKGHFRGCEQFGLRALTPFEFLREIGVSS